MRFSRPAQRGDKTKRAARRRLFPENQKIFVWRSSLRRGFFGRPRNFARDGGGRQLRRVGSFRLLGENQRVAHRRDAAQLGHRRAGAGGNEASDDDVLFQAFQRVDFAVDGRLGEDAGRLLEGRGRDERARLQAGLGDAEQNRGSARQLLAFGLHDLVGRFELGLIDLFAGQEVGVAGIDDIDLLQHLTDNHFNVLVVDADALQPVDLLDFVDQIGGELLDALDRQNVVRRRVAVDDVIPLLHDVAVLQMDVFALGDQIFDRLRALFVRHDRDALLVLEVAPELDRPGDFRDDRMVLRTASLEQLRHARQTARDVARLGAVDRDTGDDVARIDLGARLERDDRFDRQHVTRVAAARHFGDFAVLALDDQ